MKLKIAFLQLLPADNKVSSRLTSSALTGRSPHAKSPAESDELIEENLKIGIEACKEAKKKGADIALFPEMWSIGYQFSHDEEKLQEQALPLDSFFLKRYSELAKELDMAIAVTFLEKHEPKPRNTVCLFDRHGILKYRYSKVHICNFGEEDDEGVLDAGDEFFVEDLDTKEGVIRVGSMICYDREFPESARVLMLKGAELVLVPNACPMEINRLSQLRGRAFENMLAIATCNYPAPHPDCNGHSTLFDGVVYVPEMPASRDTCIFEAGKEAGIYLAELDVDLLRSYRKREVWGVKNRRPELYGIMSSQE